jgi:hypothetical protein
LRVGSITVPSGSSSRPVNVPVHASSSAYIRARFDTGANRKGPPTPGKSSGTPGTVKNRGIAPTVSRVRFRFEYLANRSTVTTEGGASPARTGSGRARGMVGDT